MLFFIIIFAIFITFLLVSLTNNESINDYKLIKIKLNYYLDINMYLDMNIYLNIIVCILNSIKLRKRDKNLAFSVLLFNAFVILVEEFFGCLFLAIKLS